MTVKTLKACVDLVNEMSEGDDNPVAFVYQRTTGEILFAVFSNPARVDIDLAPDVLVYVPLDLD